MIFTLAFWKDAIIRAVKTFAQSAVAVLAAGATGLLGTDWMQLLSVAGLAAVVSLLTSIASGDSIGTAYALAPGVAVAPVESNPPTRAAVTQADVVVPGTEGAGAAEISDAAIAGLAASMPTMATGATSAAIGGMAAAAPTAA
ncbi:holin [Bifidobacterium psychraerophilum]|uniref:Holin n=1 Tax=Bifidobacterium psychraerophilum TaxID=218140 RepID=A0A087CFQ1_9BIFI|nr:holin [Bifidobacterium psychraerophilum]KFI82101.1 Holin [Bifidobacterium psychraerophilum]PKA94904.1 phage r1t holin [Bifidobacterium psychraerophilum DSM 22366]